MEDELGIIQLENENMHQAVQRESKAARERRWNFRCIYTW